jgi:hypothetical protein
MKDVASSVSRAELVRKMNSMFLMYDASLRDEGNHGTKHTMLTETRLTKTSSLFKNVVKTPTFTLSTLK